jgi:hypothetical protein
MNIHSYSDARESNLGSRGDSARTSRLDPKNHMIRRNALLIAARYFGFADQIPQKSHFLKQSKRKTWGREI